MSVGGTEGKVWTPHLVINFTAWSHRNASMSPALAQFRWSSSVSVKGMKTG